MGGSAGGWSVAAAEVEGWIGIGGVVTAASTCCWAWPAEVGGPTKAAAEVGGWRTLGVATAASGTDVGGSAEEGVSFVRGTREEDFFGCCSSDVVPEAMTLYTARLRSVNVFKPQRLNGGG